MPILSTVGFNTTRFASLFSLQLGLADTPDKQMISMGCFGAVVEAARRGALEFYDALARSILLRDRSHPQQRA